MIKFNNVDIAWLAHTVKKKTYTEFDLLNQAGIKRLVEASNEYNLSLEELKKHIINNTRIILDYALSEVKDDRN